MPFLSQFFGKPQKPTTTLHSLLDVVNYTASLASNPKAIDTILDTVRLITSELQRDEPLSAHQQEELIKVYLNLERYLTSKEPLRAFRADELRRKFTPELLEQLHKFEKKTNKGSLTESERGMVN